MTQSKSFLSSKELQKKFTRPIHFFSLNGETFALDDKTSYPVIELETLEYPNNINLSGYLSDFSKNLFVDALSLHAYILSRSVPFSPAEIKSVLAESKQIDKYDSVKAVVDIFAKKMTESFPKVEVPYVFYGNYDTIVQEFFGPDYEPSFLLPKISAFKMNPDEWIILDYARFLVDVLSISLAVYPIINDSLYLIVPISLENQPTLNFYTLQLACMQAEENGLAGPAQNVSLFMIELQAIMNKILCSLQASFSSFATQQSKKIQSHEIKIADLENQIAIHQTSFTPQTETAQQISW